MKFRVLGLGLLLISSFTFGQTVKTSEIKFTQQQLEQLFGNHEFSAELSGTFARLKNYIQSRRRTLLERLLAPKADEYGPSLSFDYDTEEKAPVFGLNFKAPTG